MSKYIYEGIKDFDLDHIFDCGQCFRWTRQEDGSYTGIAFGKVVNMQVEGANLIVDNCCEEDFSAIWHDYLDMGRDYGAVKDLLAEGDPVMARAIESGTGIRILKQDLWETIVSFIISQNNNIPRIKGCIENLARLFGESVGTYGEAEYYNIPTPEVMAALTAEDLTPC
ncbi:MAG: 8-oxoguanine DNA glycosylase, partial [Firmicutes bacterium]|nr:8-oxoguanine DNA glycosylase [Bacillota bacterium]